MDHRQSDSDEIDLGRLLLNFSIVIKKRKFLIAAFVVLGIAGGFFHKKTAKPVYESEMMIESNILTEAYSTNLTETLDRLISEKNYEHISQVLEIGEDQAAQIVNLSVVSIDESKRSADAKKNAIFKIHVQTLDNTILEKLEIGIISFLENNDYVKKRIELRQKRLKKLISKINGDITEMDSLKKIVTKTLGPQYSSNNNVILTDPSRIYSTALSLYEDETRYENALELSSSIQLIEGFVPFEKPISPKLSKSVGAGVGLSLFLVIGLIIVLELNSYLKKLKQELDS